MKHIKLFEAQNPTPNVSSKYAYLYPVDQLDKLDLVFTAKKDTLSYDDFRNAFKALGSSKANPSWKKDMKGDFLPMEDLLSLNPNLYEALKNQLLSLKNRGSDAEFAKKVTILLDNIKREYGKGLEKIKGLDKNLASKGTCSSLSPEDIAKINKYRLYVDKIGGKTNVLTDGSQIICKL